LHQPELISAVFVLMVIIYLAASRIHARSQDFHRMPPEGYRRIAAYDQLNRALKHAIEAGEQLHCSLGSGGLYGLQGISALVGVSLLSSITRNSVYSDRPPLATSGDGMVSILAQDVQQKAFSHADILANYSSDQCQISGLSPWSYAAGALPLMVDQEISMNILVGHFDSEVGLLANASECSTTPLMGGSDSLIAQSILYASAQNPVVAEELYVAGAYIKPDRWQWAGLQTQDFFRWVLIGLIFCGLLLKMAGWL
jgi:hypothetical protein